MVSLTAVYVLNALDVLIFSLYGLTGTWANVKSKENLDASNL